MCYAGIEEFVYPMRINDIPFGFVSVSGYTIHQEKAAHRIKKISKATYLSYNRLLDAYYQLKPNLPDQRMLETLVAPAAHLYEYMYMLELRIPKNTPPEILIDNYIFYSVFEYIKNHFNEKISVSMLAEILHCSESYINHNFKKLVGMNINKYINTLRLNYARELLSSSDMDVQAICAKCGFNSASYFSSVFRTAYGCTPLEFRKSFKRPVILP